MVDLWDFSGSLAVKTSPSNAMGSFVRELRSYMPHSKKKKKKQKTKNIATNKDFLKNNGPHKRKKSFKKIQLTLEKHRFGHHRSVIQRYFSVGSSLVSEW